MAPNSSSGTSSSSGSMIQNPGSEGNLQAVMDHRKRKRMISNRESARRSRLRKQKHLDGLMAQLAELRKENQRIAAHVNVITEHYLTVAAENSILRVQADELGHRLQSLNEIIGFLNTSTVVCGSSQSVDFMPDEDGDDGFSGLVTFASMNQPILASANMFEY